jgi:Uma2 family endonuclease
MATVLETPAAASIDADEADFTLSMGDSVVLHGVSWKLYRKLRRMRANRNIRMTYDRGELEIMSPSPEHEGFACLLGDLIRIWTLELGIPIRSCGRMTVRRSVLERGFEPDNCYYIQHEPQMWNKRKINFKTDPPPDLAVEVEVTRHVAMQQRPCRHHLGVQARVLREKAVEVAAVPIGPVHHRGDGQPPGVEILIQGHVPVRIGFSARCRSMRTLGSIIPSSVGWVHWPAIPKARLQDSSISGEFSPPCNPRTVPMPALHSL